MKQRVAFYMTGNYARILRHCAERLNEFECVAFCPNDKALQTSRSCASISSTYYLYENFNEIFQDVDLGELDRISPSINQARILAVDKSHYKRFPMEYQLRVLNTMGAIFARWLERERPNFIVFPIIESVDAMLMYEMALIFGCKPLVHAHARNLKKAFFSHSYLETIPFVDLDRGDERGLLVKSEDLLRQLREQKDNLSYDYAGDHGPLCDDEHDRPAVLRLLHNCVLKLGRERHNQTLQLITKAKVFVERLRMPVLRWRYLVLERLLLRATPVPQTPFEFFPLHFSPESSINVPAPFYIDQERVVDEILLNRKSNLPLYLKEHPAMFGARPLSFYKRLMRTPFVRFIRSDVPASAVARRAEISYSITGTICLEAFLLGRRWRQFGKNFLSDWVDRRRQAGRDMDPVAFIADVLAVSDDFLIVSPNRRAKNYRFVMSEKNIDAIVRNLRFHIENYGRWIDNDDTAF